MKSCERCRNPNDGPYIYCQKCRDRINGLEPASTFRKPKKPKQPRKRVSIPLLRQRVDRLQKAIDGIRRLIDDPQ